MKTSFSATLLVCCVLIVASNLLAVDSDNDGLADCEETLSMNAYIRYSYIAQLKPTSPDDKTTWLPCFPAVCGNGMDYLITWDNYLHEPYNGEIYGIIVDANGNIKVDEFQINTTTARKQEASTLCSINGNYLVVWNSYEEDNESRDLFGQLLDSSGNKIGTEFQINTYTTGIQTRVGISSVGNNYMVAWISEEREIRAQLFNENGVKIGSERQIYSNSVDSPNYLFIAASNSKYLIAWSSHNAESGEMDVHACILDNDGNTIISEFKVNDYDTSEQFAPCVASDGTNFMITWASNLQDGDMYGIYAKQIDPYGNTIKPEFRINEITSNAQMYPYICFNGTYYFVAWQDGIWWEEYGQSIYNEIHALSFDSDLNTMMHEVNLRLYSDSSTYLSQQRLPKIASNGTDFILLLENWDADLYYLYNFFGGAIFNPGYGTYFDNPDSDGDGLSDFSEVKTFNTNPMASDSDGDGLNDSLEVSRYATDPNDSDSDDDYINDGDEINTYQTDPNSEDSDNDGLADYDENTSILFSDGFESNTSDVFLWSHAGDKSWVLYDGDDIYAGDYCASSPSDLDDSESATLILTINYPFKSNLSFKYKVSSEAFSDELKLFVNSIEIEQWSGDIPWSTYSVDLPAGVNTIAFTYVKDRSFTEGLDRAFLDDIVIKNIRHGTNPTDDDSDDDGCIDGDEIYAATDPLDPASNYSITGFSLYKNGNDIEGFKLIWNASPISECYYTVMCKKTPNADGEAVDLFSEPWLVCEDNIPNSSNITTSWIDTDQDIHDAHKTCKKLYKILINKN